MKIQMVPRSRRGAVPGGSGGGRSLRRLAVAALSAVVLPSVALAAYRVDHDPARQIGEQNFKIEVLSGQADTVTGGDALLRIDIVEAGVRPAAVHVRLNGADVTSAFTADAAGKSLTGLVGGMVNGRNQLEVVSALGIPQASLALTNFPIQGPVFSGTQQEPFYCQTHQFAMPAGLGMLTPTQIAEPCQIPTRVDYIYKNSASALVPWPAGATKYPSDVALTANGKPYIVRLETGTINRGIYQIAMLQDPIAQPAAPTWKQRSANWNGSLIYTFGGGCTGGWYRQGTTTGGVTDDFMLSQGFAVASSTMNVPSNNCNIVVNAETMMMVKERFIEAYGPPTHTQGFGCSAGAFSQHEIADNYPGLLDGIVLGCSFPDGQNTFANNVTDGLLLQTYRNRTDIPAWTDDQIRQVSGFMSYATIKAYGGLANRIDPDASCGVVPGNLIYNPTTNPTGVRCTIYDDMVNVYGKDPTTGFARRPLDNVGIQYGLKALNVGAITVDQFLDLNEKIGGFDQDGNVVAQRTQANLQSTLISYKTGRVTNAGMGLGSVPIIDYHGWDDNDPNGQPHAYYHAFSMRKRLQEANGQANNQVMLVEDFRYGLFSTTSPLVQHAVLSMNDWLTNIAADTRQVPISDKIARDKPAGLLEGCNTRDANPTFIAQTLSRENEASTVCGQLYPSNSFPREVAGEDVAASIIKCQLRPVDMQEYAVPFTDDQKQRLNAVFSGGVCDWSRRGALQTEPAGTWIKYR